MLRRLLLLVICTAAAIADEPAHGIYEPLHGYFTREPQDRFSHLRADLKSGAVKLDTSGDLPFLRSVLGALEVPVSSQTLVYSVTSLQKALISPRRPRALYFNDDTYVGYVPDGRVEVISTDPELGNIFYIFDRLSAGRVPRVERNEDCMNCHAAAWQGHIPALTLESVIPGMSGGGERAFRRQQVGHAVPLGERFGGWHVTGAGPGFPPHHGNVVIERRAGEAHEIANPPGAFSDLSRYLLPTSDVLPLLLQEHQAGFVDLALQAAYTGREQLAATPAPDWSKLAHPLVRYLLFADEAPLTAGGVPGDPTFRADFQARRRATGDGASLRDFDLSTRLFRYRCSYMIYSPAFTGLPEPVKSEVFRQVREALSGAPEYAYLGAEERLAIRQILTETLPGYAGSQPL